MKRKWILLLVLLGSTLGTQAAWAKRKPHATQHHKAHAAKQHKAHHAGA